MQQKTVQLIAGIVLIAAGIVILLNPKMSALALLGIIGALLLVYGIAQLVYANRTGQMQNTLLLVFSILSIVLGTVLLLSRFFKVIILSVVSYGLGAVLVIRGIIGIVFALQRRDVLPRWWIALLIRIVYIVLGVLLFIFPMGSGSALVILLAVGMITFGADLISERFLRR